MLYVDSSYLFRLYSTEPGHEQVKALAIQSGQVFSAWHARAEFAAIVLRKRREQPTAQAHWLALHRQFLAEHHDGHIDLLPLTESVIARLESTLATAPPDLFLRAADAMHLACAAEHGFGEVYSNDRHFLAAAPLFGLKGINILGKEHAQLTVK
jgi:predicted nucleic acid-binding protein